MGRQHRARSDLLRAVSVVAIATPRGYGPRCSRPGGQVFGNTNWRHRPIRCRVSWMTLAARSPSSLLIACSRRLTIARLTQRVRYSTPSILSTICSAVESSAASSFPSVARRSIPASCRQVNFVRYSAGRCFSTSARTSPKRGNLHHFRNDDQARRGPRPIRAGNGLLRTRYRTALKRSHSAAGNRAFAAAVAPCLAAGKISRGAVESAQPVRLYRCSRHLILRPLEQFRQFGDVRRDSARLVAGEEAVDGRSLETDASHCLTVSRRGR
jgi:hypothetical protein